MQTATFDVLVLGVGGMGAAALAHLAARGVSVIGVEQLDVPNERGSSVGETRAPRRSSAGLCRMRGSEGLRTGD